MWDRIKKSISNNYSYHGSPCHEMEELIWGYVTGSLQESQRRRLENHLPDCDRCREAVATSQRLHEGLAIARQQPIPTSRTDWRTLQVQLQTQESLRDPAISHSGTPRMRSRHARSTRVWVSVSLVSVSLVSVLFAGGLVGYVMSSRTSVSTILPPIVLSPIPAESVAVPSVARSGWKKPISGTKHLADISPTLTMSAMPNVAVSALARRNRQVTLRRWVIERRSSMRRRLALVPSVRVASATGNRQNGSGTASRPEFVLPLVRETGKVAREFVMDSLSTDARSGGDMRQVSYVASDRGTDGTVRELQGW